MNRRDFIALLGSTAAAMWSLGARAQQTGIPLVGLLDTSSADAGAHLTAFSLGLKESGFAPKQNVAVEYRSAEEQYERLPELAADLINRKVTVLACAGIPATLAAKKATASIPIVFSIGSDPTQIGLVESLNRPGGNITGITSMAVELEPKRVELLHELMPSANVFGLLVNPSNPNAQVQTKEVQAAAQKLGIQVHIVHVSAEREFDAMFSELAHSEARALAICNDGLFISRREQLAALALRHGVPAIFQHREFAVSGGLMSYGGSLAEGYRQLGIYASLILKGAKPSELPVQQSAKIELIINLNTAKALGLTLPITLLGRADEVIE
jgi:putative ABC transport system substrate-binding protein